MVDPMKDANQKKGRPIYITAQNLSSPSSAAGLQIFVHSLFFLRASTGTWIVASSNVMSHKCQRVRVGFDRVPARAQVWFVAFAFLSPDVSSESIRSRNLTVTATLVFFVEMRRSSQVPYEVYSASKARFTFAAVVEVW